MRGTYTVFHEEGKWYFYDPRGMRRGWWWKEEGALRQALLEANKDLLKKDEARWNWGWLVRKESLWMGVHYSAFNKRWCINLIPCVTLWITRPGGKAP
jgi:hypothetical protein